MRTVASDALLSDCGTYRYELSRTWDPDAQRVCWVMLNPSTADASNDDPTIRRCMGFARSWGYGGITVVNLFAYRATDPSVLAGAMGLGLDIVGPLNGDRIVSVAPMAGVVVAAWGAGGRLRNQGAKTCQLLAGVGVDLWCLGATKGGMPRHPLYVPAATDLVPYRSAR